MQKAKGGSADIQRLRHALVREGMMTYPLAMQALAEFRKEVFSILDRVAKRKGPAISQIVGSKVFERHWDEVDDFLDGPDTSLSVCTKGACSFRIDVFWQDVDRPPAPVRIAAGIWCDKRATFEKVDKALQDRFGKRVTTNVEDYECYLERVVPKDRSRSWNRS